MISDAIRAATLVLFSTATEAGVFRLCFILNYSALCFNTAKISFPKPYAQFFPATNFASPLYSAANPTYRCAITIVQPLY